MKRVWFYHNSWGGRWPSAGEDEYGRATLVIPNPLLGSKEYGDTWRSAVVIAFGYGKVGRDHWDFFPYHD